MPMCQCGYDASREIALYPVVGLSALGFSWAGVCRDGSMTFRGIALSPW